MTSVSASLTPSLAKDIAVAFGSAKKAANGYVCHCPVCNDSFLAVREDDLGQITFICSKGCDQKAIWNVAESIGIFAPEVDKLKKESQNPENIQAMFGNVWLEEPLAPVFPILEGLFDRGDKIAIIGQSKTRKSFFTMQMALLLACGKNFLGYSPPHPLKVLIVQYEIKGTRYHARCQTMMRKLDLIPDQLSNLIVINARGINCDPIEILKKQTEIHKPDLAIVDPLYKLISGDESKIEEIKPILRQFDILTEETGASVAYVHHDKKGLSGEQQLTDRGAGSGVIARDIDTGIYLSPHKDQDDTLVIEFIGRNHAPQKPISIEWRDYHFDFSNASQEKQTTRNQSNRRPKLKQQMESVYSLIKEITAFGDMEMGAGIFNIRLKDIGISKDNWAGIKEQLTKEGRIEIKKKQSKQRGESNLMIYFLSAPELAQLEQAFNSTEHDENDLF